MNPIAKKALEYDKFSGCSQSVLLALQEDLGIGDHESFKAATVLSGGVARRGETCGAYLGGLMALGLVAGREDIRDTQTYRDAMKPANEIRTAFMNRLQEVFGFKEPLENTICTDIQERIYGRSYDLTNPIQYKDFLDAGGHSDQGCPLVCAVAAEVTAKILSEL
ncbi:MAG: C-GCAxxG-C-C family protein [Candidatus Bathyarchaeota archaeon]|nr:C-GCAxxG-C-C family protein [Candidatus Bathyarchaeota archaeon]